ncbi:MAG: XdhC family protein [Deltaproteobacteria bacterium]|nr:XdhC family protein [Deltaproteobacteria bacterium]
MDRWYRTAKELEAKGESFVLATVVRAVAPTSAKPGDKAVVTEAGVVHGWIGGSCAEPTIKKEAKLALADGACRIVQITPDPSLPTDREGLVVVPMTCYSGGELEIYLEPHRAKRELVVFGNSPVAQSLVELGVAVGYEVTVVDTTERPPLEGAKVITALDEVALKRPAEAAIVVATHGVFDEDAVARSVELGSGYLGVVASLRRFSSLGGSMQRLGVSPEAWARVDGPAGIDIGAKTPQEIAVSIIAAITAQRESIAVTTKRPSEAPQEKAAEATGTEDKGHCCHD